MPDDHDRCEWVNVSSGTGSPRLSQPCEVLVFVLTNNLSIGCDCGHVTSLYHQIIDNVSEMVQGRDVVTSGH